jgi:AraC-like DNA-binding protein
LHAIHIFRSELAGRLVKVGEFTSNFATNVFCAQLVHKGTACHREFYPEAELLYKPGYDFFRHADRLHTIPSMETIAPPCEMTALTVSDHMLAEMIGPDLCEQLLAGLGLANPPAVTVVPIPLHVSAALRTAFSETHVGPLKRLYAQSKILEYLCALATYVCNSVQPVLRDGRKRRIVHELHEYLTTLEGKLPSLDELTTRCGLSARWLNEAFAKEYGQTIYSFISDHRLKEAQAALITGDLPIKTISSRLGYSHVNHFTIAFKRKFGCTPGSLRLGHRTQNSIEV